jgi:hypothetical protein
MVLDLILLWHRMVVRTHAFVKLRLKKFAIALASKWRAHYSPLDE